MLKNLLVFSLALLVFPVQAHAQSGKAQQATEKNKPSLPSPPVGVQQGNGPSFQSESNKHVTADVRVVSTPQKDGYDRAAFWANIALVGVGIGGIAVALCTLRKIERQTNAVESNIRAMVAAERAWIVISVNSVVAGEFRFWG